MAIGGDTHNYQRYPVTLPDGRVDPVRRQRRRRRVHARDAPDPAASTLEGVTEAEFKCYPLRSDSLARFSQLYDERLAGGRGLAGADARRRRRPT